MTPTKHPLNTDPWPRRWVRRRPDSDEAGREPSASTGAGRVQENGGKGGRTEEGAGSRELEGWARSPRTREEMLRRDLAPIKNLTRTRPGELVEVDGVVFRSVQDHCRGLGIGVGCRLLRRESEMEGMIGVEDANGRAIDLHQDDALFVWVRSLEEDLH